MMHSVRMIVMTKLLWNSMTVDIMSNHGIGVRSKNTLTDTNRFFLSSFETIINVYWNTISSSFKKEWRECSRKMWYSSRTDIHFGRKLLAETIVYVARHCHRCHRLILRALKKSLNFWCFGSLVTLCLKIAIKMKLLLSELEILNC